MSDPAKTIDQNILPVQALFNLDNSFNTFIGQGQPFYATTNPDQTGLNITNSTINSTTIGATTPSTGVFTNILTTTGQITTTPTASLDIANKAYVDATSQGLSFKQPVLVTTTGNITLSGTQTIDGIAVSVGDRVLVKNQTATADNGIYLVASGAWSRSPDANTWDELLAAYLFVLKGTVWAGSSWVDTNVPGGTLGVTPVTFVQFSNNATYTAGTGLTLTGFQFSITPVGTAGTYGSASNVPVLTTNASGQVSSVTNTPIAIGASQVTSGTFASSLLSGSYTGITGVGTLTAGTWNGSTIGVAYGGTGANTFTAGYLKASGTAAFTTVSSIPSSDITGLGTMSTQNANNVNITGGTISGLSSPLAVASGGSGATTLTGYLIGNGTSAFTASTTIPTTALSGTISNAQLANSSITINGNSVSLGGSTTVTALTPNTLTIGTGLSGGSFNGSAAVTIANTGVLSFSAGTTGFTPSTTTTGAVTLGGLLALSNGGTNANLTAVAGGILYSGASALAISAAGTTGQFLQSNGAGAPTWATPVSYATVTDDTTTAATRYPLFANQTSGSLATEYTSSTKYQYVPSTGLLTTTALALSTSALTSSNTSNLAMGGNLGFSDTGILANFVTTLNGYAQYALQNKSNGAAASTEFIAYNDAGTASANFATFGINSSGYTGTGAINAAGYSYFLSGSTDIVVGTIGANSIHLTTNSQATDAVTINTSNAVAFNGVYGTAGQVLTSQGSGSAPTWTSGSGLTITDDTSTNATRYLTFTSATSGTVTSENVSSTKLQYNPSTGTLKSVGQFSSDSTFGFKNRIINGAMMIDQRNAGASVTPANGAYTLDRWRVTATQASKISVQQNASSVTPPVGFSNYLGVTSLAATTLGATDDFNILQFIEANNISDLTWGTASASPISLSFWVRSSLTGTFGGSISNSAASRSYPFTYTISSANTWEYKTISIAGDTVTALTTGNGIGLRLMFGLGVGTTYSGTAGAWVSGGYDSATGATSVVGTNGATFYITGVQLEKGSTATSFDYRPYGTELSLCQRYYYRWINTTGAVCQIAVMQAYAIGSVVGKVFDLPITMRTAPSASTSGNFNPNNATGTGQANFSSTIIGQTTVNTLMTGSWTGSSGLVAGSASSIQAASNAYIEASAEL